jgi:hypothetical protein
MPLTEAELRTRARELIHLQELPDLCDDQVWAGPGTEAPCCLCNQVITRHEMEYEIEAADAEAARRFRFHMWCHAIWECECTAQSLRLAQSDPGELCRR